MIRLGPADHLGEHWIDGLEVRFVKAHGVWVPLAKHCELIPSKLILLGNIRVDIVPPGERAVGGKRKPGRVGGFNLRKGTQNEADGRGEEQAEPGDGSHTLRQNQSVSLPKVHWPQQASSMVRTRRREADLQVNTCTAYFDPRQTLERVTRHKKLESKCSGSSSYRRTVPCLRGRSGSLWTLGSLDSAIAAKGGLTRGSEQDDVVGVVLNSLDLHSGGADRHARDRDAPGLWLLSE